MCPTAHSRKDIIALMDDIAVLVQYLTVSHIAGNRWSNRAGRDLLLEGQEEVYVAILSDARLITTAQTTVDGVILMSRKPSDRKAAVATSAYNHGEYVYRTLL